MSCMVKTKAHRDSSASIKLNQLNVLSIISIEMKMLEKQINIAIKRYVSRFQDFKVPIRFASAF